MARYAVVESGTVTNVIEWDGSSPHADSAKFVAADGEANAQIGATYNGSAFAYTHKNRKQQIKPLVTINW